MKERPILFNDQMVRAILSGDKTKTRRPIKPEPISRLGYSKVASDGCYGWVDGHGQRLKNPKGKVGDRLWVREAFMHEPAEYEWEASVSIPCRPSHTIYRADFIDDTKGAGWMPSIYMPRKLSRIDLAVTGVLVERLRDISRDEAMAEGIIQLPDGGFGLRDGSHYHAEDPRQSFFSLWASIYGHDDVERNPWLWVTEFNRVKP